MEVEQESEIVVAELVPTHEDARQSVERAKGFLDGFWGEIKWQVESKAWESLGYATLNEMWNAEYAAMNVGISRAERPELVGALRSAGQTQQEIAGKLGVHVNTVANDISNHKIVGSGITNSRGQERPASYADRKPRPAPIPRQFDSATLELQRVMDRFGRISSSDNFNTKNKRTISEVHLSDIDRAIMQLTELRNELEPADADREPAAVTLVNEIRGPWRVGITHAAKGMSDKAREYLVEALRVTAADIEEMGVSTDKSSLR